MLLLELQVTPQELLAPVAVPTEVCSPDLCDGGVTWGR